MRQTWIIISASIIGALFANTARAGVYFTTGTTVRDLAQPSDPDALEMWPSPSPFKLFQIDLADYRVAAANPDPKNESPLRKHYLRRIEELKTKQANGLFSLDDRINLGAYYIRLAEYKKALAVLQPAQKNNNFMLQANLAYAYEMTLPEDGGDRELAVRCEETALDKWPTIYPGWDTPMLVFYRQAEEYYLKLLRLRHSEMPPTRGQPQLRIADLFPRVRFSGSGGKYQAGSIAPKWFAELPKDAIVLVMQLHLWLPFDNGLGWLLGELLNSTGDVNEALEMLNQVYSALVTSKVKEEEMPPDLLEHKQLLEEASKELDKTNNNRELQDKYRNDYRSLSLLCAFAPRGMGLGAGDLIQEASWVAIAIDYEDKLAKAKSAAAPSVVATAPTDSTWVPNWRQLAVGFGTGALVALLLGLQIRQMGRAKG